MTTIEWIKPNWNVPAHIKALTTTRNGGVSAFPFEQLNLSVHVQDDREAVLQNRVRVQKQFDLPHELLFLKQTHSDIAFDFNQIKTQFKAQNDALCGDALYTNQAKQICTILTADCLPVLFCNRDGSEVAAAHAGWQGLQKGILESTLTHFKAPTHEISAWFGPAISAAVFEVGQAVYDLFVNQDKDAQLGFKSLNNGQYLADIYALARLRLQKQGMTQISGGNHCTYLEADRFYSYRRAMQDPAQQGKTGRMLSAIWIEP